MLDSDDDEISRVDDDDDVIANEYCHCWRRAACRPTLALTSWSIRPRFVHGDEQDDDGDDTGDDQDDDGDDTGDEQDDDGDDTGD